MKALSLRQLSKTYRNGVHALKGIDLDVQQGDFFALLGPNGAGKTTALRMLAGILTPTAGRVVVNGLDLQAHPLAAKQQIGFLSGDTQLYHRLTSREVLCYFGRLYGMADGQLTNRIEQLVTELEMNSFADRPCRTLSTGQKQRANIARAGERERRRPPRRRLSRRGKLYPPEARPANAE